MGDKIDRLFCDTIHDSKNCNAIRDQGNYGKNTFLSTNSNDNDLGRSVSIVGTLYNEEDEFTRDELSKQAVIPCQNAIFPGRQNHYDGIECSKPSINSEFDDFGGKREDNTNHVRSVGSQWGTNVDNNTHQPGYSDGKGKGNTGTRTVLSESSKKIQFLYEQLGPLLRVIPLGAMHGTRKRPATLYCRTIYLKF
ncbi:hypothetical protein RhiirB3_492874 [Rhizophagus irregularis]|nr:hypothetical protein RhiirB3_492874 [Rhizophagus irregularis]